METVQPIGKDLSMDITDYLVSYGHAGELACFRPGEPILCRRGNRVVVRTHRGLEIGEVRCPATARAIRLLENTFVGELLRLASPEDEQIAGGIHDRGQRLFTEARRLTADLTLPLEILDVEVLFDGHQVTLYYLRSAECDERPLVSALSKKYDVMVAMHDLALPAGASGCGRPDCGQKDGGGCTTCGTGGCSTGCGSKLAARELQTYFAGLRQKMEAQQRMPLL